MNLPNFRIINNQRLKRFEAKVVEPLKAYGNLMKMKRDDLKATLTARNGEAQQLGEHTSAKPIWTWCLGTESELQSYNGCDPNNSHLAETDNFEKQKIKAIKTVLCMFRIYH